MASAGLYAGLGPRNEVVLPVPDCSAKLVKTGTRAVQPPLLKGLPRQTKKIGGVHGG